MGRVVELVVELVDEGGGGVGSGDPGVRAGVGVGNKVDSDEAREAIEELCAEHDVPLDVVIPSTSDIVAADRWGEPLDREIAPEVWDAVESLVDSLDLDAVPVG